jgi:ABC-type uncharacterized transport system involved in gliding motility auxiliary subunit
MDKQEATDFVIRELGKRRNRDDIITELCQRTGGTRDQVQRFVQLVESQNRPTSAAPLSATAAAPRPAAPPARSAPTSTPTPAPAISPTPAAPRPAAPPARSAPAITPTPARAISPTPAAPTNRPAPPPLGGKIGDAITQENTAFVINELGKHRNRNDLIMALCEKTGGSWNEMQRFVQQVESQNRQKITARQSPILIMIGAITVIGGLGLLVYTVIRTMNGYAWGLPGMPIPYLGNLTYAATSLGMLGGGTLGTLRTLRSLMK